MGWLLVVSGYVMYLGETYVFSTSSPSSSSVASVEPAASVECVVSSSSVASSS